MTNAKESYEAKILEKLIDNSERLAIIETKLIEVQGGVKNLDVQVENLNTEVHNLNTEVKQIDSKLSETQREINSRFSEIQREMDSRFSGIEERINKINDKQNWFFTILAGIGTGILATLYSQPILTALSNFR